MANGKRSKVSNYKARSPASREKRHDTLSAYLGETTALLNEYRTGEVDQRIRAFSQSSPDDLFVALEVLGGIRDAIIIIHGPRGCAAAQLRQSLSERGGRGNRWLVTNLSQRETIMGADGKLRTAVVSFYRRYGPKAIFIVATPPVAINNDDIQSVVNELSEELGTVIVPIFASGFTSKASAYGYDLVLHSLIKYLVKTETAEQGGWINLLSLTESEIERAEAQRLVAALGLGGETLTLPAGAGVDDFARAAGARLSVPLNFDASNYLGEALQEVSGVPFLPLPRPIGLAGTRSWLHELGVAVGKEHEAREFHANEAAALAGVLESAPLRGKRVYISTDPATGLGLLDLIQELGGEVVGLTVEHLDRLHLEALQKYQDRSPALQIHIANRQGFEEVNLLQRIQPDLYIGSGGQLLQAVQLGIPSVFLPQIPILGYIGIRTFAHATSKALRNRAFVARLAKSRLPYHPSWSKRSANWHIKQEVK